MSSQTNYETTGPLSILTFNRPEARNAMTWEMYDALMDACDRVEQDSAVRVFVLRGAGGKAFVAGTDITQFQGFRGGDDGIRYEQRLDAVLDRLEAVRKPTIAQVEGVAAGGGCAIALACDLRVATPDARFGVPIARTLGNCLSGATLARFTEHLGPARVKELIFTGRFLSADEAHAVGLVNRISTHPEIESTVRELALEVAASAPLTILATKDILSRLMRKRRLAAGEDRAAIELCYRSADFREGVASFLAKRKPQWSGT